MPPWLRRRETCWSRSSSNSRRPSRMHCRGAVASVEAAYAAALAAIPDGRAKRQGIALGQAAAAAILALRAGDGSDTPLFDRHIRRARSLANTASHLVSTSRSRRDGAMSPPLCCATARSSVRVRRTR